MPSRHSTTMLHCLHHAVVPSSFLKLGSQKTTPALLKECPDELLSVSLWSLALPNDRVPSSRSIIKANTQLCSFPKLWLPQQQE
ncbi:hypothetical protein AB3S75_021955 [Citrus x aurantiifolia]